MRRPRAFSLAIAWLLLGSGCSTVRPSCKVPEKVQLELESSDRVNRDEKGRSLPTIVRLYQLSDLSRLEQATFEDIWEKAKDTLGPTLIAVEEITMYPGQVMMHRFERNKAADFLVGAAVFRQPAGDSWRTIQEWPLEGDPCDEKNDKKAAPKLEELRVRMFLEDYRIESVNNYAALQKRHCPAGHTDCSGNRAPNELPEARRNRHLRTFEEDSSQPQPTVGPESPEEGKAP